MADNRKYYYLKLKEGFFESEEIKILESMKDGYIYSNILLKLYLRSLRNEGRLMYRKCDSIYARDISYACGSSSRNCGESLGCF